MKSSPRFTALLLAWAALAASACRAPVWLPEFDVETATFDPAAADDASMASDGGFVVSWSKTSGEYQTFGRAFSADTVPLGASFPVNPDMNFARRGGSMARDASGRYLIVWAENDLNIWGQRWNADGTPIGANFQVNSATPDHSYYPHVASDPSGNFVVAWTIVSPDTDGGDVVVRRFDANGVPLGDEFRVHEHSPDSQIASDIAMSASNFVVTWSVNGSFDGALGRVFDSTGTPITGDFPVNTTPLAPGTRFPHVAMNGAGDFVVVWDSQSIRGRRFAADGQPFGDDFPIRADTTVLASGPRVSSDSNGNILVTWHETPPGAGATDVFGRFYALNGDSASDAFLVNELTGENQFGARPSLLDDGSFVVAFASGGFASDVKARKNGVRASPEIVMDPLPTAKGPGGPTMGNGVFEPGETQVIQSAWINESTEAVESILGQTFLFTGPPGPDYTIVDGTAFYDVLPTGVAKSCIEENDCFQVTVSDPGTRPLQHWDALLEEQTNMSLPHTWVLHLGESFPDVPPSNTFYRFVETLFHRQVTGGCAGGGYCPTNPVTRAQMAVFLLKAKLGSAHVPPPCTGTVFADVPCSGGPFDPWIEELASLQITGGCGNGNYCPGATVTRQQMAVFLLKAFDGSSYVPPSCAGVFDDVPCTPGTGFSDWIEELATRGITSGCSVSPPLFCPTNPNNRGQMAAFLVKTFGLVLYGG